MILLRKLAALSNKPVAPLLFRAAPNLANRYSFSQFFEEKDSQELHEYEGRHYKLKLYRNMIKLWKKPLQDKQKRRARLSAVRAAQPKPVPEAQKLVVHNAAVGIEFPAKKNEQFCVIKVDGFQYKVMEDTLLVLDRKPDHQINKPILFTEVLLYGSRTYTAVGRPLVGGTQVQAIVESMSDSQKIIVFKKKRRKQYKKSYGHRTPLTMVRITKIVHQLSDQALSKAVKLDATS